MGIAFNADEVLEMAEEIERNGAKFYREAADKTSETALKDLFLNMAKMEDGHLRTFHEMREELAAQEKEATSFDPYDEAALYLQTMADAKGSEGLKTPEVKLTGNESPAELITIAIGAEKNSVLFYVGLRDFVSTQAGRNKVEAIIREEVKHVADLKRELAKLN